MPVVGSPSGPVSYRVRGDGAATLLIHGSAGDYASNFALLQDALGPGRRIVGPDYAGSGDTPLPAGPLSLELLADQVWAAVEAETDGDPVDVVGFSLGALVAATVAARHRDRVRSLVLVSGWVDPSGRRLRLGVETWAALERTDHRLYRRFGALLAFSPGFVDAMDPDALAAALSAPVGPGEAPQIDLALRADISAVVPRLSVPVLVVGATQDQVVPVHEHRRLHHGVAHSTYVELDSGHAVVVERAAELAEHVRGFWAAAG